MKYAIYSQRLKAFFLTYQGKGLFWNDNDFGSLESSRLYKQKSNAMEMATDLFRQFDTVVIPVEMKADMQSLQDVGQIMKNNCASYLLNVAEIDALDADETEALSTERWNEYKMQREYLRTYSD